MATYTQTGAKICPKCKEERKQKKCPVCGSLTKASGKWSVVFDLPTDDGSRKQKRLGGFESRRLAELAYIAYKGDVKNFAKKNAVIFNDVYNNFLRYKTMQNKASSIVDMQTCFNRFILPYFGGKDIDKITSNDILKWQMAISEPVVKTIKGDEVKKFVSVKYKNKIYGYIKDLFNHAVIHFDINNNPCLKVQRFRNTEKKKEMRFWTPTQFNAFIEKVDNDLYKVFFDLLYFSGLRPGEAIALKWNDFKDNLITVDETISRKLLTDDRDKGFKWQLTSVKNTSSDRVVLLPEKVVKELEELKNSEKDFRDFSNDHFIFGGKYPISDTSINRQKKEACAAANLPIIRLHDFRHSHASVLISMGFDILSVGKRLGHSDIKQTLNTYGHMMPNAQSEIVKKLEMI